MRCSCRRSTTGFHMSGSAGTRSSMRLTVRDAIKRLREGEPSIEVRPNTDEGLELGVWLLEPGEAEIVARRLRQVLRSA